MTTSSNNQSLEKTSDLHVVETRPLIPPSKLHFDIPLDYTSAATVSIQEDRYKIFCIIMIQEFSYCWPMFYS